MENKFIHLKLQTEYSLLEGVGKIEEYIKKAKEIGLDTLAITDTAMFGVIEFYKKCKKENIKPIIGLTVYLDGLASEGEYSLTLIAKNQIGYKNLSKLSSLSYSRFSRRRNKIKYEELMEFSDGLFVLSGGIYSESVQSLIDYKYAEAKKSLKKLMIDFGENFYVEIPSSKKLNNIRESLIEIIQDLEANYLFTNDVCYCNEDEAILQKIVKSIKEGNKLSFDSKEKEYTDLYLKKYDEIKQTFVEYGDEFFETGIKNIEFIVNNSQVDFNFDEFKFPKYDLPEGVTEKEYLREIVYNGLNEKYENKLSQKVIDRIEYELKIINDMGYNGYFIIVWDFIKFSRENGVYVGPGRGSAAGSLVSYALNITEIDPIEYNLIFERFLNPERISMPDIDIDFDQEQREIVIDYVLKKYGKEHVAHIITFGTLKARAAIRDVGRVLGIDLKKVDIVAKLIPHNMELQEGIETIKSLRELYNRDNDVKVMIDYSKRIEGKVRHASVHAAGLVISKEELNEEIPLYSDGKMEMASTQYQMKELEDLGVLKIDFLGLKNLTVLRKTIENIEKNRGEKISLNEIKLDDKKTYELFTKADTLGVFQCESFGIRNLMKKVKIEKFEDIIALLALYRPGPLRSGMVDDFIAAKNTSVKIKYPDESLKNILEETYGVILYQEQVMKIANEMADYSLGEADELRRAIGKKIPEIIEQNREKFVTKAVAKGVKAEKANYIYNLIDKFGGYGFNKSHSAAYALIVYWTAYFKVNYMLEFFAALMSTEMYNIDRLSVIINEAREKKIEILVPDVNFSSYEFTVEDGKIRFGMTAIKGVGINFVEDLINVRNEKEFKRYDDFVYRMKQNGLNKKNLESLILSGSLDGISGNRREKFESIEKILEWAGKKYIANEAFELMLFGNKNETVDDFYLEKMEEFSQNILLKNEKNYLGIYVSNHPLNAKKGFLEIIEHLKISELDDWRNRNKIEKYNKIKLIGIIKDIKKMVTKTGDSMVKFNLEDFTGMVETICFPKDFIEKGYKILEDKIVLIEGTIKQDGSKYSIILNDIVELDEINEKKDLKLYLLIDNESRENTEKLKEIIKKYRGENVVYFAIRKENKNEIVKFNRNGVNLSKQFLRELVKLLGMKKIKIK